MAAFRGEPADRVPIYHTGCSSRAASHILGREAFVGGGIQRWRESVALWNGPAAHREFLQRSLQDARDLTAATGQDLFRWAYWRLQEEPTERIDEHTFLYGDRGGFWRVRRYDPPGEVYEIVEEHAPAKEPLETMDHLERHVRKLQDRPIDPQAAVDAGAAARDMLEKFGGQYLLRFGGGELCITYGEAIWLEAIAARPDLVGDYLDRQVEERLPVLRALAAAGVKAVFGGGDLASSTGPFYSPADFRALMLPRLRRLTAACRELGMYYLFGTDGHLWPIAPDLFGASGVDGYYEPDRRAGMDLSRLRDSYPNLTVVGGNISSITQARGTVREVIDETRDCLETARARGRIIVGVSNAIVPETPPANIDAMLETIEKHR